MGYEGFVGVPSFLAGSLAVGVISGAYQAEVFRAAYLAIARGELEAAVSVGMNRLLMFRRIIAPQVLRFALPGLGNLWQVALKDSSLISVTGLTELMRVSQIGAGSTHQPFAFYLGGMALYLIMTLITTRVFDVAEARATRGMRRCCGVDRMDLAFIGATFIRLLAAVPLTLEVWALVGDPRRDRRRGRDVDAGQRLEAARDHCPRLCRALPRDAAPHSAVHRLLRPCVAAGGPSQPLLALPARRLQLRRAVARRSAPRAISPKSSAARCWPCRTGRSRRPAPAACRAS